MMTEILREKENTMFLEGLDELDQKIVPVSYTHLDVYKRQGILCLFYIMWIFPCYVRKFAVSHFPASFIR